jgi:fermentation-respiration switch protein FrsA (DUF1100 family)
MGSALGTIPTVHIAVLEKYSEIRGLILLSPIISKEFILDIYNSLPEAKCPVLLIHGQQDEVTPYKMSLDLVSKMRYAFEWFPSKGTHINLTTRYRTKLLGKLKFFLEHLSYQSSQKQIDLHRSLDLNTTIRAKEERRSKSI